MTKAEKAELRKEWEERVAAFKASGQSTTAWCAAHDLKPQQLRYWLRKLNPVDIPTVITPQWLSVEIGNSVPSGQANGLCIRIGHAVVEVQPGFDPALLKDVVRTLVALC
ncbi:IS66 family insertion sequence element accessory protein TnpA [Desulfolucanica intricata]|uniref:IS66 family insertion sequence element accessory protein TnpA n=1 Tax=Desulfolucanica intricata TaxID=1285191 RepID=UPI00082BE7B1|nr:hypothetical protein [Desulfolucanica intricata]